MKKKIWKKVKIDGIFAFPAGSLLLKCRKIIFQELPKIMDFLWNFQAICFFIFLFLGPRKMKFRQKPSPRIAQRPFRRASDGVPGGWFFDRNFLPQKLPNCVQNWFLCVFQSFWSVFMTFFFCLRYAAIRMHKPHLHTFFASQIYQKYRFWWPIFFNCTEMHKYHFSALFLI